MTIVSKSRAAAEFRAKADAVRAELLDASKSFTADEVVAKRNEIRAFEERAQEAAEFTPDAEIRRQGAEQFFTNADEDTETDTAQEQRAALMQSVRKAFGGVNGMLRAMKDAQHRNQPLNSRQQEVLGALKRAAHVGTASDASGGEYLLPLQQEASIFRVDFAQGGILDIARRYNVSGRSLRIPYVVQTDGDVTRPMAGFAEVAFLAEAGQKPERTVKFLQRVLNTPKIAAFTQIGDELLADDFTGDLAPTVQAQIGTQMMNFLQGQCTIDGAGSGTDPLGAFNGSNGALYKVARNTASDFKTADVFEMLARVVDGPNLRWYMHSSVRPKLYGLTLNGTTLVSFLPDLNGRPGTQLMGIPVVFTDVLPVLGTEADVALANGDFYAYGIREGLRVESSIHYDFRNDVTSYRFVTRGGGIPIPTSTYSYKSAASVKTYEKSPFVVLDNVVAS